MFKIITALFAGSMLAAAAQAQDATADLSEHEALALEMMELSGSADVANTMVDQMIPLMEPSFRQGYPNASDAQIAEALAIFAEAFRARNPQMNAQIASLYADLLSTEDLRAINAFYHTEAGQNLLASMPEALAESTAIGERLAMEIMAAEGQRMRKVLSGEAEE